MYKGIVQKAQSGESQRSVAVQRSKYGQSWAWSGGREEAGGRGGCLSSGLQQVGVMTTARAGLGASSASCRDIIKAKDVLLSPGRGENSSRGGRWWEWGSRIKENMNLDRTVETRDTPCLAKGSHQPHSWRMADRRRRGRLSASWMESKVSPSGGRMRRCCV